MGDVTPISAEVEAEREVAWISEQLSGNLTPQRAADLARELYARDTVPALVAAAKIWIELAGIVATDQKLDCAINAEACMAKAGLSSDSTIGRFLQTIIDLGLDPLIGAAALRENAP